MHNATMRQLRVFAAAAHHLSFAQAARELHLTPPAVSIQIAQLEVHAGARLFERLGRKLFLTQAGHAVLRETEAVLSHVRQAEEALGALRGVRGGVLNIGVISAGDYFFPSLLATFCGRHEGVRLKLSVSNREDLIERIDRNAIDLAVMGQPPEPRHLAADAFAPHPMVIVGAPTHPLVRKRAVPLAMAAREPLIVREPGSATRVAMDETFRKQRIRPNIAMEIATNETIKQAVRAQFGIGFLSAHAIGFEITARALAIIDIASFPVQRQWYAVHRSGKTLPPVAAAFKAFLLDEGAAEIRRTVPRALRALWR
jgi:LysR family transcriptional regulator, low CO2-responsive transcriptional regulator